MISWRKSKISLGVCKSVHWGVFISLNSALIIWEMTLNVFLNIKWLLKLKDFNAKSNKKEKISKDNSVRVMMTKLVPKKVILKMELLTPLGLSFIKTFRMIMKTSRRLNRKKLIRMTTLTKKFRSQLQRKNKKNRNLLSPGKVFLD